MFSSLFSFRIHYFSFDFFLTYEFYTEVCYLVLRCCYWLLWSEDIFYMIQMILNVLRLILWPKIWYILKKYLTYFCCCSHQKKQLNCVWQKLTILRFTPIYLTWRLDKGSMSRAFSLSCSLMFFPLGQPATSESTPRISWSSSLATGGEGYPVSVPEPIEDLWNFVKQTWRRPRLSCCSLVWTRIQVTKCNYFPSLLCKLG